GLSIVFVTHDIGAAVEIADRIAVMYGGSIVEEGSIHNLMRDPRHPYTLALLKSRREGGMEKGQRLEAIGGAPPDLSKDIPGCPFAPRCPHVMPVCTTAMPPPVTAAASLGSSLGSSVAASMPDVAGPADHSVRCYLYGPDGVRIENGGAVQTGSPSPVVA
ncbi:MAG: oligopeptide/dipeptide ABC transporter ATP-binding protein, partial [Janthinobacterium lividum]